jgi:hypothetical protein
MYYADRSDLWQSALKSSRLTIYSNQHYNYFQCGNPRSIHCDLLCAALKIGARNLEKK